MRIVREIDVAAPRNGVWKLIADDAQRQLWMPDLVAITYPAGRPNGDPTGTRIRKTFKAQQSIRTYSGEVTAYVEHRLRSLHLEDEAIAMSIDYHLGGQGHVTRVRYAVSAALRNGGGGTLLGLVRPLMEARMEARLRRLKSVAEDRPSP